MNKLILLDQFYEKPENAKWEQRRYEIIKDLASKAYEERSIGSPFVEFNLSSSGLQNSKLCADRILALINPQIAFFVTKNVFKVSMKKKPKNYEEFQQFYGDLSATVESYDDLPSLSEIRSAFHRKYRDLKYEDTKTYTEEDFEIRMINDKP